MKIIFDSVEEFNDFINYGCPSYILGLNDHNHCEDGVHKVTCAECWEQSGLEYEIKNEESIEMKRYVLFTTDELRKLINGDEIKHHISGTGDLYFMSKYYFEKAEEMVDLKHFYERPFVDLVYETVKNESQGLDSIYRDYIINLVGVMGLNALIEHKLVEGCGIINGRKLYVLCERE